MSVKDHNLELNLDVDKDIDLDHDLDRSENTYREAPALLI